MEFKLPFLGDNIAQGTVTKVLVKPGDTIKKDQSILELETDKAVMEVPSSLAGVIEEILVANGATVKVGQVILKLKASTEQSVQAAKPAPAAPVAAVSTPTPPAQQAPSSVASTTVVDYVLPTLGENILKGTVTKVLVKSGDSIKKGQNILELETDKAVLEVPASQDMVIKDIIVKAGAVVNIGAPIFKAVLGALSAPVATKTTASTAQPAAKTTTVAETTAVPPLSGSASGRETNNAALPVRANVPAAPSVRLFAREIGIDIAQVPGSGPGGRISIDDVKKFSKALNTSRAVLPIGPTPVALPDFSKWGNVRREAMNNVRKKTAEHLSRAWATIPHVTQFDKADITEIEKLRKSISTPEKKISITPFIIQVIAQALRKFPQFNTAVDMATNEIVYKDYVNIGVAVDTERGLIVPVIKNVDQMSVIQIHDALTAIAQKARDRKVTIDDMQGGCFTISNLGGIGGSFFTPIVNAPEVAILGVSRGNMEQVYSDGQFVAKLMLPLSLSYDHRIIDGADGARFIRFVIESIQTFKI